LVSIGPFTICTPQAIGFKRIQQKGKEEEYGTEGRFEEKAAPQARQTPDGGNSLNKNNPEPRRKNKGQTAIIGQSIHIKELTGNEDLTIDGTVEGNIELRKQPDHRTERQVKADINAKTVTIREARASQRWKRLRSERPESPRKHRRSCDWDTPFQGSVE
jgi:hypothetical protein